MKKSFFFQKTGQRETKFEKKFGYNNRFLNQEFMFKYGIKIMR